MSIERVATLFIQGKPASSHNSKTDGTSYWLHGNKIAEKGAGGSVIINWCGWHTRTTANHLNFIAKAYGYSHRFSAKMAKDNNISTEIMQNG
jgi:hypothetical protein